MMWKWGFKRNKSIYSAFHFFLLLFVLVFARLTEENRLRGRRSSPSLGHVLSPGTPIQLACGGTRQYVSKGSSGESGL